MLRHLLMAAFVVVLTQPAAVWGQQKLDLTQPYLLLATSRTSTMQEELDQAAAAGYRILVGGRSGGGELTILLEKVAQPPEVYEYKLLATQLTSTMQRELSEVAAQGFRVLPRALMGGETEIVVSLEKRPGATAHSQYLLLATKRTGTLQKEMRQAAEQGYQVLGLVSRKEHMVILEKPAQQIAGALAPEPAPESKPEPRDRYLLLATEKTSTMQKELNKAADTGFRILAGSPTSRTEIAMLLERSVDLSQKSEYKLLATNKASTLQEELNEAASKGFRLLEQTVAGKRGALGGKFGSLAGVLAGGTVTIPGMAPDEIVAVVEKTPGATGRYHYLVLDTMRTSTMQQEISKAVAEGYQVVAAVGSPSSNNEAQLVPVMSNLRVILEKALP